VKKEVVACKKADKWQPIDSQCEEKVPSTSTAVVSEADIGSESDELVELQQPVQSVTIEAEVHEVPPDAEQSRSEQSSTHESDALPVREEEMTEVQLQVHEVSPEADAEEISTVQSNAGKPDTVPLAEDTPVLDWSDPALYSGRRLKVQDINMCLSASPCQPEGDYQFPVIKGRSFNREWFLCQLPDETTYGRMWLSYSKSTHKLYCIPCMGFSGPSGSEVWTTSGYNDWHNCSRDIQRHESSVEHRNAEIAQLQWKKGSTIHQLMVKGRSLRVENNRRIMECVLDCIRFLSSEMIAFWGNTPHEGKFMALFRLIAKRDPNAAAYLMKLDKAHEDHKKMAVNFVSPRNIHTALMTMKQLIVEKIVHDIKAQKKACIIFDSTQDFSKKRSECFTHAIFANRQQWKAYCYGTTVGNFYDGRNNRRGIAQ